MSAPKYAAPRHSVVHPRRIGVLLAGGALVWASGICAGLWIAGVVG